MFSEKAVGLTTFVTTDQKTTRKTPPIDDVCNNKHQTTPKHSTRDPHDAPLDVHREWQILAAIPMGSNETTATQISHVIYRGHFSRHPKNVAIPTMEIQCLNKSQGNYVRN